MDIIISKMHVLLNSLKLVLTINSCYKVFIILCKMAIEM